MKVKYVDHMGSDLSCVNAARVSFGKRSKLEQGGIKYDEQGDYIDMVLKKKDAKLIKYLASHGHTSPFNHTYITMHVKAPIFVARQLVKHKFMPWNEISRRYVDDEPEFYTPNWRWSTADKKQGSGKELTQEEHHNLLSDDDYGRVCTAAANAYHNLLNEGVAPEQARMVLPQSTYTEWYWSGTLGAWTDMYNLRSKPDTQWETQQIANQAGEILKSLYPVSFKELTQ